MQITETWTLGIIWDAWHVTTIILAALNQKDSTTHGQEHTQMKTTKLNQ